MKIRIVTKEEFDKLWDAGKINGPAQWYHTPKSVIRYNGKLFAIKGSK